MPKPRSKRAEGHQRPASDISREPTNNVGTPTTHMGKNVNTGQHTVFRTSVATRPTMTLGGEGEDCQSSSLPPESRQTPQSSDPVETFTGDTASLTSHADTVGKRGETSIKEMHLDGPT